MATTMLQNNNACYGIQAGVEYLSKFKNIIHSYTSHTLLLLVLCSSRRKHLSVITSWPFLHLPVRASFTRLVWTGGYNLSHHFVQASEGQNVSCLYLRKTELEESDCSISSRSDDGASLEEPLSLFLLWIHPAGQRQSCCPKPYLHNYNKRRKLYR